MSDQGIFSETPDQGTTNQTTTAQGDNLNDTVALLVGEGRKYKTIDDLAKAYLHIDEFAEKLKSENATIREELTKAKTLDDVLTQLKAQPTKSAEDSGVKKDGAATLSEQDIAAIVRNTVTGLETQRTKEANLLKADAEMKRLFGEKAKEVFDKEASTPEMRKVLVELAAVNPTRFVSLFQGTSNTSSQFDSKSSVNTAALDGVTSTGRAADPGCKEFYDTLRRKDPKAYYSSAVQLQMNKAAVANRIKFFGA